MAYQVLARKYRPQRFADVIGQEHVTVTLMNALAQNRIAHGYIFSGHRGIGKTTIARILASALNCQRAIGSPERPTPEPCLTCDSCTEIRAGNAVDVIEIDAATNRGIDEIRELRDAARYRPARDKYKIYILDEAHQITDAAFNALLKTLEEPPDHIVFMMATTQPEDIPQTVRSRCQHFSFHAVSLADILSQLRAISTAEGVLADDAALALLAEAGDGSMRDALSIMDQAIASAPLEDGVARLDASQIRELMGTVPNAVFERIFEAVDANRSAEVMTVANQLLDAGNSPAQLARQAVRYIRNALIAKIAGVTPESPSTELLQISPDEQRRAARTAALFTEEELTRFLQVMLRTFDELGYRQEQRFHFELGLLKLVHLRRLLPIEEALSQLPAAATPPGRASGGGAPSGPARTTPPARPAVSAAPAATTPARAPISPFEQDRTRRRTESLAATPTPFALHETRGATAVAAAPLAQPVIAPAAIAEPIPVPAPVLVPDSIPLAEPSPFEARIEQTPEVPLPPPVFEPIAEAVADLTPEPADPTPIPLAAEPSAKAASLAEPGPSVPSAAIKIETHPPDPGPDEAEGPASSPEATQSPEADAAQRLAVETLAAQRQTAAADALEDAAWTLTPLGATVQTTLSRTMLPVVLNPEAEKIARAALRTLNIHSLTLLPATANGSANVNAVKKPRSRAVSGPLQSRALEHPLVQQAQKLFSAEVQSVLDLRKN